MISMIAAGLLICSGHTKAFDFNLQVDFQKLVIAGTMATTGSSDTPLEVRYEGLRREKACLLSNQLSFCYSAPHGIASWDVVMQAGPDSHVERGTLQCHGI